MSCEALQALLPSLRGAIIFLMGLMVFEIVAMGWTLWRLWTAYRAYEALLNERRSRV